MVLTSNIRTTGGAWLFFGRTGDEIYLFFEESYFSVFINKFLIYYFFFLCFMYEVDVFYMLIMQRRQWREKQQQQE